MVAAYIATILCITILMIAYKSNYTINYRKTMVVEQPPVQAQTVTQPDEQPAQADVATVLQELMFELGGE